MSVSAPPVAEFARLSFSDLPGWAGDDHDAALRSFQRGAHVLAKHPPQRRGSGIDPLALTAKLRTASAYSGRAREFFEDEFAPVEVLPKGSGFFTGYYEPIIDGSLTRTEKFCFPLYRRPADLVDVGPGESIRARRTAAGLAPYPDRALIESGLLTRQGLELCYLADPIDAFFIHIQGSARIRLPDGKSLRVTYAAKNGHPYTAIGRVLIDMGALTRAEADMAGIRGWLATNPLEAAEIMARNRSFIFFREAPVDDPDLGPVAAAKVPLTAGRSLAVDRTLHSFHLPVWIDTKLPDGSPFRRLLIAQDTGSAIIGPARGDIFFGSGDEAGVVAGGMRSPGRFVLLVPRGDAQR